MSLYDDHFTPDATDERVWYLKHPDALKTFILTRVHTRDLCSHRTCIIHRPSEHAMRSWPLIPRGNGLYERACRHGMGHPDPDSIAFFEAQGVEGMDVHGCDGCCRTLRSIRFIRPTSWD